MAVPAATLMGAVYLSQLDQAVEASGQFYARFMDNWVILSPSRWKLRRAIGAVNQLLEKLKVLAASAEDVHWTHQPRL